MKTTKTLSGLLLVLALAAMLPACGGSTSTSPSDTTVTKEDVTVGTGPTLVLGDTAVVNYVGTLTNGTVFDSNQLGFAFRFGVGAVIKGWDQGLVGMRVGGRRKLTVPPSLGYGSTPTGSIPANSTLLFDITLRSIVGK